MTYPLTVALDSPERIDRWRPLVQWFLAIPHFFVMGVLTYVSGALGFISFFTVLFTKRVPDGIVRMQVMIWRYGWRATSYAGFLHDAYPPFDFTMGAEEPGGSPAALAFEARDEDLNRWLPLVKWLMLIPHAVALFFVVIAAFFVYIAAFFAVLFTGTFPTGMRDFIVGMHRWAQRVNAYGYFLTDEYPPFSLE